MTKIAFCFLTYENVSQPTLWHNFFNNKQDKYNMYIHNKHPFIDNSYHFEHKCIDNCIETKYSHISVVKATLELFKKALLNPENQYFVLLSETCIPLHNFEHIYSRIQAINTNIIQVTQNNNMERFNDLTDPNFFDKNNFAKHNPCLILNRQTAEFFVNNDFTYLFNDNFYAPDEHYFVNLCNKFSIPYINSNINYSHWEWNHEGRPKTYYSITNEEINNIKSNGFLFMRKIAKECNVPLYF
jgi:hypothetical protein